MKMVRVVDCVSHIEEDKKDLTEDVHRLPHFGVLLEDSPNNCFIVHNMSASSFVGEVKSKEHLHPSLMKLKENIFIKLNELFSLWGVVCRSTKRGFLYPMWMI